MIVVDNFINNPIGTRHFALQQPFTTKGNFPGKRTKSFADETWIPYLEKYLPNEEKITWFDTHPFSYNGAFQICTENDGNSWIHADCTDWAAVLFLTPGAPAESGLSLFRHKASNTMEDTVNDVKFNPYDTEEWELTGFAGNVFNRLVMFRGRQFHKASAYFGQNNEEGRLFQVFFFNTVSNPLTLFPTHKPRVLCLILTTNRYEYLEQMLTSMDSHVDLEGIGIFDKVVFDDYPLTRDSTIMQKLCDAYRIKEVFSHDTNYGLPETWKEAWEYITTNIKEYDYVFHVEEDVVFEKNIRLMDLIHAFVNSPLPTSQVFLKRHPCYAPEIDFISCIEAGSLGSSRDDQRVYQNWYFVAMCSLYPVQTAARYSSEKYGLPQEDTIRKFYEDMGLTSLMFGQRNDAPIIRHIGTVSRGGKGPGFEHLPKNQDYHYLTGEPFANNSHQVVICIPTTPERRRRLNECIQSIHRHAGYHHQILTYQNTGEGYVKAIRSMVHLLNPNTLVWCIGDDVVLHEPNTLKRLVEAYNKEYPDKDGVVNPDDGIQHGRVMTTPLCTAKTFLDHYDARFFHYYADNVFTDTMRAANKYTYCSDIHIKHNHPCMGLAETDETYKSTQKWLEVDAATYEKLSSR